MKKIFLVLGAICAVACSKNTEQIDALKAKLIKDYGKSQEEVDSYSYMIHDAYAQEVHSALSNQYLDMAEFSMKYEDSVGFNNYMHKLDSLREAMPNDKDKKYFAVHAYKLREKDSIFNVYYYLDTVNKLVAVKSKK